MGAPALKLDDRIQLAARLGRDPADPYPLDLSDVTPRVWRGLAREGVTEGELRARRQEQTPEQVSQMLTFEASLLEQGMTLEDFWDPPPLTDEEREDLRRSILEADVSDAFKEAYLRDLERA